MSPKHLKGGYWIWVGCNTELLPVKGAKKTAVEGLAAMWLVVLWEGSCKRGGSSITLAHAGADLQHMMDEDLGNCGFYEVCEINKTREKRSVRCRPWGRSAALPR